MAKPISTKFTVKTNKSGKKMSKFFNFVIYDITNKSSLNLLLLNRLKFRINIFAFFFF